MQCVLRRVAMLTCVVGAFTVGVVLLIGCGGTSPFLAAQFATAIMNQQQAGHNPPPSSQPTTSPNTGGAITSVCDLDGNLRVISVTVANASAQSLRFSITFAASGGTGGFVCASERQNYINAGYVSAPLVGSPATTTIGCDTLTLLTGTEILTLRFGVDQFGNRVTLAPAQDPDSTSVVPTTRQLLTAGIGGAPSPLIPLPEIIVLGDSDPNFTCTIDLCSQRGFVYSTPTGVPVGKSIDAGHTQDTVCDAAVGTAPEWRLDKTVFEGAPTAFQYAAGGAIVVTALNRASDSPTDPRNQAVWLVTDSNGATIHAPAP